MPDTTLKRLVWLEGRTTGEDTITRSTGPLPSSILHLECIVNSHIQLPEYLPPSLQHLKRDSSRLRTGVLPALPATLRHVSVSQCGLTRLPDNLPALPETLEHLDCSYNPLIASLPALPGSLLYLDCTFNGLEVVPALQDWCISAAV